MERVVEFRRTAVQERKNTLSTTSKAFFALNIFQVIIIGGIQTSMMVVGDFGPISNEGMGPGRKIYMALFAGAVVYSCFLCLFAVKNENYLEVVAFVMQDFGYVIYSCIQVYHINFKSYHKIKFHTPKSLAILSILNSILLVLMNSAFVYLAYKLFVEYGWKIYKRVRFNTRLRAAYHWYELVVCLMKMTLLFISMFFICINRTVLRYLDHPYSIISLAIIPFVLIILIVLLFGIHKENKVIMTIIIFILFSAQGGIAHQLYLITKHKCIGCEAILVKLEDIPEELTLHLLYLGSVALLFTFLLSIATVKAAGNFGIGLREHCVSKQSIVLILGVPNGLLRTFLYSDKKTLSDNKKDVFENLPGIFTIVNDSHQSIVNAKTNQEVDANHCNVKNITIQARKRSESNFKLGSFS